MREATIVVDTDTPGGVREHQYLEACVAHELVHVLGFGGHVSTVRSILIAQATGTERELTAADRLALSILYDPRLRPGMTPAEARPVVRTIIAERTK